MLPTNMDFVPMLYSIQDAKPIEEKKEDPLVKSKQMLEKELLTNPEGPRLHEASGVNKSVNAMSHPTSIEDTQSITVINTKQSFYNKS